MVAIQVPAKVSEIYVNNAQGTDTYMYGVQAVRVTNKCCNVVSWAMLCCQCEQYCTRTIYICNALGIVNYSHYIPQPNLCSCGRV